MSTDEQRREEIRKRADAATSGPWRNARPSFYCTLPHFPHGRGECVYAFQGWSEDEKAIYRDVEYKTNEDAELIVGTWDYEDGGVLHPVDANFIAHARADIPWLLDRLAAVEAERDTLRIELDAISAEFPDNATHKHPETGESLIDNVRDVLRDKSRLEYQLAEARWERDALKTRYANLEELNHANLAMLGRIDSERESNADRVEQLERELASLNETMPCCGHLKRFHDPVEDDTHACTQCAYLAKSDRCSTAERELAEAREELEWVKKALEEIRVFDWVLPSDAPENIQKCYQSVLAADAWAQGCNEAIGVSRGIATIALAARGEKAEGQDGNG